MTNTARMRIGALGFLLAFGGALLLPVAAAAQGFVSESTPRYDVTIVIEPSGSILVTETIVQEFGALKDRIEQQSGVMSATLDDLTRKKIDPKRQTRADVEATLSVKRQEVAGLEAHLAEVVKGIEAEEASLTALRENFTAAAGTLTTELHTRERTFFENLNLKKK